MGPVSKKEWNRFLFNEVKRKHLSKLNCTKMHENQLNEADICSEKIIKPKQMHT